jgi:hypothetical protein
MKTPSLWNWTQGHRITGATGFALYFDLSKHDHGRPTFYRGRPKKIADFPHMIAADPRSAFTLPMEAHNLLLNIPPP